MLCIQLLSVFSERELDNFNDFLSCNYFNSDKYVNILFQELKNIVLQKRSYDTYVQINLYRVVFSDLEKPKIHLNKQQRNLLQKKIGALKGLVERFLMIESQENDISSKLNLLYPTLLARKQFNSFRRHWKKDVKQLDQESIRDAVYYEQRYKIEATMMDYLHQNGRLAEEDNLLEINYNLDLSYLLQKLDIQLTALSLKWISGKKDYSISSLNTIEVLMEFSAYADHPLVQLYQTNIELYQTQDSEVYTRLLTLLDQHHLVVPNRLLQNFYANAINFCTYQMKSGYLNFINKIFELYQIMHEKDLIKEDNFVPIGRLKNIVSIACKVEEFEWAKQLLDEYRRFVRSVVRESVYQFNLGVIAFYQKDYETAYEQFSQTDPINLLYDVNTRILILKCLYEIGSEYQEPTMQAFRTMESFFKRHKSFSSRNKKASKNFIHILKHLYRIRYGASKMTLDRVRQKLELQELNSEKIWLLEKIESLGEK